MTSKIGKTLQRLTKIKTTQTRSDIRSGGITDSSLVITEMIKRVTLQTLKLRGNTMNIFMHNNSLSSSLTI